MGRNRAMIPWRVLRYLARRDFYREALRRFLKMSFLFWQKLGFHVTPNHYFQPIPDTRALKDDCWLKQSELPGINIDEKSQISLLSTFCSRFKEEYELFPESKTLVAHQYFINNDAFESVDAEILYCMIRYFKPRRIFEIGSGYSTFLSAQAILKNREEDHGYESQFVAIEPYPSSILSAGFPGLSELMPLQVQDVPLSEFNRLEENDILFIDSSHVLKIGSDVQYECLEILPKLNKGVIVHFHDIFLPAEYPKKWVLEEHRFWTEQYLLQAFLSFNEAFKILWAGSYMHLKHPAKLEAAFSSYKGHGTWPGPGSFWLQKK